MQFASRTKIMSAAITLPFIFACNSATDAGIRRPVNLSLAAVTRSASVSPAATAAFQITSLKLLVNQASLGSGDQFGCQDCSGNDGANEVGSVGGIVSVPLDGTPVSLATEQVQPGSYSQVEVEVGGSTAAGWPSGQTVEIQGTNNGTAFTIGVPVNGSFRENLAPPVVVTTSSPASIPVTITLPVASWFSAGGAALDPAVPAQRAQIEANIRTAFSGPESGAAER
ncbi:MAG TPA: hypothetical protein VGO75_17505 [Gemmatimonadaceae bacterium]|jgi:hypothetical protein|nr:hypothetical protein [Gemmatimonadaceae bacterium]